MTLDLSNTLAFEQLRADGSRVLAEALAKAGKGDAGADLCGITEMLLNDAINGLLKDPTSMRSTVALSRLSGFLSSMAMVAGKLPTMGIEFEWDAEQKKLTMR
jgi:hypothetical protein